VLKQVPGHFFLIGDEFLIFHGMDFSGQHVVPVPDNPLVITVFVGQVLEIVTVGHRAQMEHVLVTAVTHIDRVALGIDDCRVWEYQVNQADMQIIA